MKLLGFSFKKISIDKIDEQKEAKDIKINTNVNIKDVIEVDSSLFKFKDSVINVKFYYIINYSPDFAKLEFEGSFMLSLESKLAKEILKDWKDKKMSDDFKIPIINLIVRKVTAKALSLEDDFNLPLHLPMPTLQKQAKEEK